MSKTNKDSRIDVNYWNHAKEMLGVHGNRIMDQEMFGAVMRKYAQLKSGIYVRGEKLPLNINKEGTIVRSVNVHGIPVLIKVKKKNGAGE